MQAASSPRMWMPLLLAREDYSERVGAGVVTYPEMEVPDDPEEEEEERTRSTWTRLARRRRGGEGRAQCPPVSS